MRNSILNILQVNVFRIQNKTLELNKALEEENINITLMQETIQNYKWYLNLTKNSCLLRVVVTSVNYDPYKN